MGQVLLYDLSRNLPILAKESGQMKGPKTKLSTLYFLRTPLIPYLINTNDRNVWNSIYIRRSICGIGRR